MGIKESVEAGIVSGVVQMSIKDLLIGNKHSAAADNNSDNRGGGSGSKSVSKARGPAASPGRWDLPGEE